jgi:hypothetical protein
MNPELIDDDIRRQNWRGSVPLQISLYADDFSAIAAPEPAFCSVSRMTYLPLVLRDTLPLLLDAAGPAAPKVTVNNCWVESEGGDAVQWHLPVGALYDALVPLNAASLVLKLCIRCSSCPPDVMRLFDIDDAMKPQCVPHSVVICCIFRLFCAAYELRRRAERVKRRHIIYITLNPKPQAYSRREAGGCVA